MKLLTKDGEKRFVADSLAPAYEKQGWAADGEVTTPPHDASPEDKTSSGEVEDGEDFTCEICGKSYKTEAGLSKHMAKEHPEA